MRVVHALSDNNGDEMACAGALIDRDIIITTAECAARKRYARYEKKYFTEKYGTVTGLGHMNIILQFAAVAVILVVGGGSRTLISKLY